MLQIGDSADINFTGKITSIELDSDNQIRYTVRNPKGGYTYIRASAISPPTTISWKEADILKILHTRKLLLNAWADEGSDLVLADDNILAEHIVNCLKKGFGCNNGDTT